MLCLFETPAGFALFKVQDEKRIERVDEINKAFDTPEAAKELVQLHAFKPFKNTQDATEAANGIVDSKLTKPLKKFLKKHVGQDTLAVMDSKLGNAIKKKLEINCVYSDNVLELVRGLRSQLSELLSGTAASDLRPMALGLSHSLSRYKLQFSAEKVDTMVVQAIGLLDDLDKELNTYAMRTREWYGWHFPEMGKIVTDNIEYAKVVKQMGRRSYAKQCDLESLQLDEAKIEQIRQAAQTSMGTDISETDAENIQQLADQVISLAEYRAQLSDYLKSRMQTIAPNLTVLVGELVGARLISHAGSLMNLAKHPASTVQILGAEKALFRALKTKHETPKYGLIYHASLVGQSAPKLKGKISRVLAAKCALSIRVDALAQSSEPTIGIQDREKVEARLRQLEGRAQHKAAGRGREQEEQPKHQPERQQKAPSLLTTPKQYNTGADVQLSERSEQSAAALESGESDADGKAEKKKKKKRKREDADGDAEVADADGDAKQKKKKKSKEGKKAKSDE